MGHLGCSADVLDLADYKCSGRRSCQIRVPDSDFEATSPCLELKSFLKASYFCIKGDGNCCSYSDRNGKKMVLTDAVC